MILGKGRIEDLVHVENEEERILTDIHLDATTQINNPAKVELSLGSKCYLSSDTRKIVTLSEGDIVKIQPNVIFLYQTNEKVNLPNNIAGKISLKMKHTAKGLLMSNQTQIDPGYNNYVFGMLYNLSDASVEIRYKEPLVSLEFFDVDRPGDIYNGDMNRATFEKFASTRITSSLGNLEGKVNIAISKSNSTAFWFKAATSWLTLIITMLTVVVAVVAYMPIKNIKQIEKELSVTQQGNVLLKSKLESLNSNIDQKTKILNDLQLQINNLKVTIESKTATYSGRNSEKPKGTRPVKVK